MVSRRLSALALLLSCASAPLQANTDYANGRDCWQGSEVEALKLQRFKTMLLVAMLNCRDREPGMEADYNRFVRANRALIASRQAMVRSHFMRAYGSYFGLRAWSDYETALGNQFSDAEFTPMRCAEAAAEARLASYVSERGLVDMLESVPSEDLAICESETRYAVRPTEGEDQRLAHMTPTAPPPPERMAAATSEAAQTEWPDLAPVEPEGPAVPVDPNQVRVAVATVAPAAETMVKAAEPVEVAAVQTPKPALPADRVKAVRDAAKALREALAALEADQAETGK